jgi:MFS family permease
LLKRLHNPLAIVFLTLLLDKLGENIVYPLLPFILEAYKPDALTLGLVASTATLFGVLTSPLMGSLSDSIGRRPVILACIGLNVISLLMFGWAGSLSVVFLSRAVNGVATSTMGTLQAYITDISNPGNRARNLGISGAAFGIGAIAGPALGGGLVHFGPSVPVFVAAGLAGYNLLTASIVLRETLSPQQRQPLDLRRMNLIKPVLRLITAPRLNRIALAFAAFNLCFAAFTSLLVLSLKDLFGWNPGQTSGVLVVIGVTLTVVQVGLIGKLVKRWGEINVNRAGLALTAGSVLLIPVAQVSGAFTASVILLSGMVLAVGAAFVLPTARSLVSGLVAPTEQGVVLGSLASLTGLASAIGPIAAGWIYDKSSLGCFLFEAFFALLGIALLGRDRARPDLLMTSQDSGLPVESGSASIR